MGQKGDGKAKCGLLQQRGVLDEAEGATGGPAESAQTPRKGRHPADRRP